MTRKTSPHVHRLALMWRTRREEVRRHLPEPPGLPADIDAYLADVREHDRADAYHSLSIAGYRVAAGILSASDLAGYRNAPVDIRNASHVPPAHGAVREMMPALFDLLAAEPSAAVRAVVGHCCFVFIHPYMDGNGRIGRFLMNAMLSSGGYPWTIIRVEWRDRYMAALDTASARGDIGPFAQLLADATQADPPKAVASAREARNRPG